MINFTTKPKTFLRTLEDSTEALANALVFYTLTYASCTAIFLPIVKINWNLFVLSMIGFYAISLFLSCVSILIGWRAVGGKITVTLTIFYTCYVASVAEILSVPFSAAMGHPNDYDANPTERVLSFLFFIAAEAWFISTWRAYRAANETSRARSVLAYIISSTIALPLLAAMSAGIRM
jgi:hypothetical protein